MRRRILPASGPVRCRLSSVLMADRPPLRGDRHVRGEVLRLADLTVNTDIIEGYQFSNCRLIGPAVIALLEDVTITHCTWGTPNLEAMFWEVPPTRGDLVVGAIGVRDCLFSNCQFEMIGVAGPPEMRSKLEQGFSAEPPPQS